MPFAEPAARVPALARRDRIILWAGLGAIAAASWLYFARMAAMAETAASAAAPLVAHRWSAATVGLTIVMWSVMMVAMMAPSAGPMVAMYLRLARGRMRNAVLGGWMFTAGYLIIWTLFSAVAAVVQLGLERAAIVSPALQVRPLLGGIILAGAGLYQFTPLKDACLSQCRSPLGFFVTEWKDGLSGAVAMGLRHGTFCVGCCWTLMALLFVVGVMNLLWCAAIAIFVILEKAAPHGRMIANAAGVALIVSGVALAASG